MADERVCEKCGTVFVPRREHARFCCVSCRVRWNREHVGDPAAGAAALLWSITAMSDAAERLPRVRAWDRPRALAAIGEMVWWVTIVDATLVRHHQEAYDGVMVGLPPAQRRVTDGILAGLRFVRNRMSDEADLAGFLTTGPPGPGAGRMGITGWAWKVVPRPALTTLTPRGQAWEMTRYQAYRAWLVGHTTGDIFGDAVAFLKLAATGTSITDDSAHAAS